MRRGSKRGAAVCVIQRKHAPRWLWDEVLQEHVQKLETTHEQRRYTGCRPLPTSPGARRGIGGEDGDDEDWWRWLLSGEIPTGGKAGSTSNKED